MNISSFDASGYIDQHSSNASNLPNIGIAVSGGGYRALTNGAGAIKAFDNRTQNSTANGHLGGLLQSATYLAGLSGGTWLLGSMYVNNFTTISSLQTHKKGAVWQFGNSILEGPDKAGPQLFNTADYYKNLVEVVKKKRHAGYNTSLTDYWGRALSYQLFDAKNGGPSYTWSSIAQTPDFRDGKMPMPLVVADGRNPGETIINLNSTVYEFNPWEFGTWDPNIYGFAPLEYLGSDFDNGKVPGSDSCVRGFDNAGFVVGSSSTLFNQFILRLNSTSLPKAAKSALRSILGDLDRNDDDVAVYHPNPFYNYRNATASYSGSRDLSVVDGGEDNQNIPFHPLIQPQRHVDVIFAVDSSADTAQSWPNGSSLVASYERSLNSSGIGNGTVFPPVPDTNSFVNLGLNRRPTFFGCNSSNLTTSRTDGSSLPPLVVYLPNYPYVAMSNVSTFELSYSDSKRDSIITNGYEVVTMGNGSRNGSDDNDTQWSTCVGCAVLSRSLERTGTPVPSVCSRCFDQYCWNGTTDTTTPDAYEPNPVFETSAGIVLEGRVGVISAVALVVTGVLML